MQDHYSVFRKFRSLDEAIELKELLKEHHIESILDDNVPPVDITFSGNTVQNQLEIRIKPSDFEKAEAILEQQAEDFIHEVDKDHYLFEFTNEELFEILLKSDEWSPLDYSLAQQILESRGKTVDKDLLKSLKKERLVQLAKPEGSQTPWIFCGYIFSLLGGFIGLIIGYFLWTSKKSLPNGQKVYSYQYKDRMHGKYIFFIGLLFFPTFLLLRIVL